VFARRQGLPGLPSRATPVPRSSATKDFSQIPVSGLSDLPKVGVVEDQIDEPPTAPAPAPAPAPAAPAAPRDACAVPIAMSVVTSGPFGGGLSMDDYYPDIAGRGFYDHPSIGGTFDTGARVGANVQLNGIVPSPCSPGQYTFAQTVTYTRAMFDGVRDPAEGVVQNDIAKSGRDQSRAPFRQLWLGGGLNISMADPPSTAYTSTSNIEWDRSFTTSLIGPGGSRTARWQTSIRVEHGVVTRNTLS
jgi:hypothetical protein